MPRLRNKLTGSVVNVSDADAENLGPDFEPIKDKAPADDKPARRSNRSS